MKIHFSLNLFLGCLAAVGAATAGVQAQTVTTDPVGAITLTLKGGSDTQISLPFHRPVALETQVASISGNVITVAASANITSNQFVYVAGSQTNHYYLQFTSGNRSGMYYSVTTNDASSITIDPNGDTGLSGNVNTADIFRVIPYWTLNTLFPNGANLYTSPGIAPQSSILLPSDNSPGINFASNQVYFYYTGSLFGGPGWRQTSDLGFGHFYPDVVLPPDSFFTVRHPLGSADTQLVLAGNVPMSPQAVVVNNLQQNVQQDNAVSLPIPVSITLGGSGLYPNIISGSPGIAPVDSLLVFDPTSGQQNKPATAVYFYYTGSLFGGPGWRTTNDLSTIRNNDTLAPGLGFIIRRAARSVPGSVIWTYTPSYLNN